MQGHDTLEQVLQNAAEGVPRGSPINLPFSTEILDGLSLPPLTKSIDLQAHLLLNPIKSSQLIATISIRDQDVPQVRPCRSHRPRVDAQPDHRWWTSEPNDGRGANSDPTARQWNRISAGVARRDPQVENDNPITIESDPNSGNTITVDPDGPQPKCATPTDGQDMTISDDSEQIANVAEYGSGTQDEPEDKPGPVAPPGGIVLSG